MIAIRDAAIEYLDTPFHHQGRTKWGIDCVGLIVCSARDCGIEVEDFTAYRKFAHDNTLEEKLLEYCYQIDELEDGCIVQYKWKQIGDYTTKHLAIYLGEGLIIHADGSKHVSKVCKARLNFDNAARIAGYWKLRGV